MTRCYNQLKIVSYKQYLFYLKKTDFGGIIIAVLLVQINNAKYYLRLFPTDINNLKHRRINTAFYRIWE